MRVNWETGFRIAVRIEANGQTVVSANREGLLSLSNILRTLADQQPGTHIHLDEFNSLEDGSSELVLERAD